MPAKTDRRLVFKRAFVLLRLPVLALLLLVPGVTKALTGTVLALIPYPHSAAKMALECWHVVLLRQELLPALLIGGAVTGLGLTLLPGKARLGACALALALALFLLPWGSAPALALALLLLLLNFLPRALWRRAGAVPRLLPWLPGAELALPWPSLRALGWGRGRPPAALVNGLWLAGLAGVWLLADSALARQDYQAHVLQWPEALQDERVALLDRAPVGSRGDFHGVEITDSHAVVVAEDSLRLLAVPLDEASVVSRPLSGRWGARRGGALESFTESWSGATWVLTGPDRMAALHIEGGQWRELLQRRLPGPLDFAYLVPLPALERLALVTVNASDQFPGSLFLGALPDLSSWSHCPLLDAQGRRFPTPRDVIWLPTLQRLLLVPNFGRHLYLADPQSCQVEPWIETLTMNGKPVWVPELERLFLAQPERRSVMVIDPSTGTVERRIPTQPGARTLAVDVERNLLLTASVLTGAVLVQCLDDGAIVDRFATLMPMARELALAPAQGAAFLTTWTALYRIPYAEGAGECGR